MQARLVRIGKGLALPVALIALWEVTAHTGSLPRYLVAPSVIAESTLSMALSGELLTDAIDSLLRAYSGFLIGAGLGIALGLLAGVSRAVEGFFDPLVSLTYPVPKMVNRLHVWSALNMGASRLQVFAKVILPSAAPQVLTGLRIGLALAFIVMFAAEMVGAKTGLGNLVMEAEASLRFDLMYAAIIAIGVLGFASDRLLLALRRRLLAGRLAGHVDHA